MRVRKNQTEEQSYMLRERFGGHWDESMRWKPTHWLYVSAHAILFLLGVVVVNVGGTIAVSVGTSLIAAGVAGWILFLYVWMSEQRSESIKLLSTFGFERAYNERGPRIKDIYENRLNDAEDSIDIIGFGLRTFREDFGDQFENWSSSMQVRVLLIDPDYPPEVDHTYSNQRDKEEENRSGKIQQDVREFINGTGDLQNSETHDFEVRLYKCLPSVTIFRIDDEMFWGPYTVRDQSRNMPIFLVKNHGYLYSHFQEHFDTIWEQDELSRSVPQEWFE